MFFVAIKSRFAVYFVHKIFAVYFVYKIFLHSNAPYHITQASVRGTTSL